VLPLRGRNAGLVQFSGCFTAYQPIGPKLRRFVDLVLSFPNTKFSCLVDNIKAATEISEVAVQAKIRISAYVDLNVGQDRTGIKPGNEHSSFTKIVVYYQG